MKKPNIVFVLSDQQRWDTLAYAGVMQDVTPNLDRLAKEGVLFENCFSAQPVCGPTRACLQSGRYATETGNFVNGRALPTDINCVGKLLKEAGYDTAYVGKWHLAERADEDSGRWDVPEEYRAGFDYWRCSNLLEFTSHAYGGYLFGDRNEKLEIKGYRADGVTDYALDYIRNHSKGRPFYLMLSLLEPHHQNDEGRFCGPKGSRERYGKYPLPEDLQALEGGDQKEGFADYLGACNRIDWNVGRIEELLKELRLWDDTVFIYASDHGCHFKTRNAEYKRCCHDAATHVPLLLKGGPFQGGVRIPGLVSLIDIPSTIVSMAGLRIPENYRGIALDKVSSGEISGREYVFSQISEAVCGRCLRSRKWKYSVENGTWQDAWAYPDMPVYYEAYLYDLESDPHELHNLAADDRYIQVREELRGILLDWIWEVEGRRPQILPKGISG